MAEKNAGNAASRRAALAALLIAGLLCFLVASMFGMTAIASALTPEEAQQCKEAALARPTILQQPGMYKAGLRTKQTIRAVFEYPAVPSNCAPQYVRAGQIQQEIRKGGRWITIGPKLSSSFGPEEQRSQYIYTPTHPKPAYVYDECEGGHRQKDRLILINSFKAGDKHPRAVIAERRYTLPVKIHGRC
jgi:hypothetical protein